MLIHTNKPTIVILCRAVSPDKSPLNSDYYLSAYSDLLLAIRSHGADAYFSTADYYTGDGKFSQGYTFDSPVPVKDFTVVKDIQADIVYNKGGFSNVTDVPVLNPRFIHDITSNKHETYLHFASYQPVSLVCSTPSEANDTLLEIPGEMIVTKQPTGNGGHGVAIMHRSEFIAEHQHYPLILQEFLTTDIGIPGLVKGVHDLRIKMGDGEVWAGTLRTPAEGELRANVAQGGTERHLFPEEIPTDAIAIARQIDSYFQDYPRYYSIDMANTPNGWKLIELNSKPGLSPTSMSPQSKHTTDRLAQYLTKLAAEYRQSPA